MESNSARQRIIYLLAVILCICIGLGIRKLGFIPEPIRNGSVGDAIWAMMIYFGWAVLLPRKPKTSRMIYSILFCYGIEVSQLYQAPWINEIRGTTLGGLILGFGFLWSDILAYTLGVSLAYTIDLKLLNLDED